MGGGSNNAQREAQAAESQRQASIAYTQGRINDVFSSPQREADISDYVGGLRQYYQQDLDRQKADADRSLKFALARTGQVGGSTQVDQQARFATDYAKALLQTNQKAEQAGAELRANDQDARSRLISLATSGLDATTGAQMAAQSLRAGLESSKGAAMSQGLGQMFQAYDQYNQATQDAKARQRAFDATTGLYASTPAGSSLMYGGGSK